jgi:hypothetical protein
VDHLLVDLVFEVVGVDIYGIVVIDMGVAETFDVIIMRVHDKAVAIDKGFFLSDLYFPDEDGEFDGIVDLLEMVCFRVQDLYYLDRIVARGPELYL